MASVDDYASDLEELHRNQALAYRKPVLCPIGRCHYCLESLEDNKLFCDCYCRDGYQIEEAAKERNGR